MKAPGKKFREPPNIRKYGEAHETSSAGAFALAEMHVFLRKVSYECAITGALGNPTSFGLTPGQAHNLDGADLLLPEIQAEIVIADKAFSVEDRLSRSFVMALTPVSLGS